MLKAKFHTKKKKEKKNSVCEKHTNLETGLSGLSRLGTAWKWVSPEPGSADEDNHTVPATRIHARSLPSREIHDLRRSKETWFGLGRPAIWPRVGTEPAPVTPFGEHEY